MRSDKNLSFFFLPPLDPSSREVPAQSQQRGWTGLQGAVLVLLTVKPSLCMCQICVKSENKSHRLLTLACFLFSCGSGRLGGGEVGETPLRTERKYSRSSESSSLVLLPSRSQRTPSWRLTAFFRLLARRHRIGDTRLPLAQGRRSRHGAGAKGSRTQPPALPAW